MRSLALVVAGLVASSAARAAEGESSISVAASFAGLTVNQDEKAGDKSGLGAVLGVDYQRGFGESFWLRVGVGGGFVSVDGQSGTLGVATVGLTYAVDILKYVPYVGIGAGGVLVGGGPFDTHVDPVIDLAAGIEVQVTRSFAYGIEARFDSVAARTTLFVIGPRVVWKWGYF